MAAGGSAGGGGEGSPLGSGEGAGGPQAKGAGARAARGNGGGARDGGWGLGLAAAKERLHTAHLGAVCSMGDRDHRVPQ